MATYRGRKNAICRKVGFNIWGKPKCPSSKRPYPPGQHGPEKQQMSRTSEYGEQLLAKQVIRMYYGMLERQFRNTFHKASRMHGNTGLNFLRLLELRLQTLVFRLGYANSIFQARQLVSHQHITVNGKVVDIPSYRCKVGDVIGVVDKPKIRENIVKANAYEGAKVPDYIEPNVGAMEGRIVALPERLDFPDFLQEQQVVEFYAR